MGTRNSRLQRMIMNRLIQKEPHELTVEELEEIGRIYAQKAHIRYRSETISQCLRGFVKRPHVQLILDSDQVKGLCLLPSFSKVQIVPTNCLQIEKTLTFQSVIQENFFLKKEVVPRLEIEVEELKRQIEAFPNEFNIIQPLISRISGKKRVATS